MGKCVGKTVSSYSYTHLKNSQLISKYKKNSLHSPSLHSHIIKPPCVVRLRTIYYNSGQLIFIGILIAFCIANILSLFQLDAAFHHSLSLFSFTVTSVVHGLQCPLLILSSSRKFSSLASDSFRIDVYAPCGCIIILDHCSISDFRSMLNAMQIIAMWNTLKTKFPLQH